jgi:hypothetical protein
MAVARRGIDDTERDVGDEALTSEQLMQLLAPPGCSSLPLAGFGDMFSIR